MILLLCILSDDCVHYCLENVLLGHNTLHILDQVIGLGGLLIFQIIDNQVQSGLRNDIYKRRQHLQGILTAPEHHKVVTQEVIILEYIAGRRGVLKDFELRFSCFSIVELEMVACLQVNSNN